jgi:hypothetical protein
VQKVVGCHPVIFSCLTHSLTLFQKLHTKLPSGSLNSCSHDCLLRGSSPLLLGPKRAAKSEDYKMVMTGKQQSYYNAVHPNKYIKGRPRRASGTNTKGSEGIGSPSLKLQEG